MTVIDWLVSVDKSLLPIYSVVIMLIGLYGYLKPEKKEEQESSCDTPQPIHLSCDAHYIPPTTSTDHDGDIPLSTLSSMRQTYILPTMSDILQSLPLIEDGAVIGTFRGHRAFRVNDIANAETVACDGDYVIFEGRLYLYDNGKFTLIEYGH